MTNTPMTSREAFEATYPIPSWAKYFKSTNEYICDSQQWIDACQKLNAKWEGWQACEAQQEKVIAELVEALEYIEQWSHQLIKENKSRMVNDLIYVRAKQAIAKVKGK